MQVALPAASPYDPGAHSVGNLGVDGDGEDEGRVEVQGKGRVEVGGEAEAEGGDGGWRVEGGGLRRSHVEPVAQKLPAGQGVHSLGATSPSTLLKVPPRHASGALAPSGQ